MDGWRDDVEIRTERCTVRRFQEKDIDDFMKYRNDLHWMRYQGFKGLTRQAYAAELLEARIGADGVQFAVIDNAAGRLIGDIYLKRERHTFRVGCTISPAKARQGYAGEVLTAVIGWMKRQGGVSVKADVLPENTASIGLLEKLGFFCTESETKGERTYELRL